MLALLGPYHNGTWVARRDLEEARRSIRSCHCSLRLHTVARCEGTPPTQKIRLKTISPSWTACRHVSTASARCGNPACRPALPPATPVTSYSPQATMLRSLCGPPCNSLLLCLSPYAPYRKLRERATHTQWWRARLGVCNSKPCSCRGHTTQFRNAHRRAPVQAAARFTLHEVLHYHGVSRSCSPGVASLKGTGSSGSRLHRLPERGQGFLQALPARSGRFTGVR